MALRYFNDIAYPVPGVDTAIAILRPGARHDFNHNEKRFEVWQDDEGREPPTWEEIEDEIVREVEIYNYYLYERNREQQYPPVIEQLDMLYKDIKAGNLENGSWIAAIDKVKQDNPKPDYPEPTI